jgi:hypothetical protein
MIVRPVETPRATVPPRCNSEILADRELPSCSILSGIEARGERQHGIAEVVTSSKRREHTTDRSGAPQIPRSIRIGRDSRVVSGGVVRGSCYPRSITDPVDSFGRHVKRGTDYVPSPAHDIQCAKPFGVDCVDRIAPGVGVEVSVSAREIERILRCKAARLGVVLSGAEVSQAGIRVVETAGEAKGLEAGVGVLGDAAVGVVVELLGYLAGLSVDD